MSVHYANRPVDIPDLFDFQPSRGDAMPDVYVQPYLYFNGRCDEALEFYREVLGAKVEMKMLFNESPDPLPEEMIQPGWEEKVMHVTFRIGESTLMASDGCDEKTKFDGFSLSLAYPTVEEAQRVFALLAEGGEVTMPLDKTFWSPCFGMLWDKFGVSWMVSVHQDMPT